MKLHLTGWLVVALVLLAPVNTIFAKEQVTQLRGPKNATNQYSGAVYGPIDSADTLWRIASRYKQNQNLSVYQVMVAIYELNPNAFEKENLNLLVNGSMLKLPSDRYIARIDPERAKQKAEQDEAAWALMEGQPGASLQNLKPAIPLVNRNDLNTTKGELEAQLNALDAEQTRQFDELRQQFATSIDSIEALIQNNQTLYDRLDKINEELADFRSRVDDDVQPKVDEQLALQRELLNLIQEERAKQAAEAENSFVKKLTSPTALIIESSIATLLLLGGLGYWLLKRKSDDEVPEPVAPPIQTTDNDMTLDDEPIADLSSALEDELDTGDLSDDELFNDDDLLDDVLSTELEDSLEEELESFADLSDDMLVPDEKEDENFEQGDDALAQNDLDSLFDDEMDVDDDDISALDGIDLSGEEESDDTDLLGSDDDSAASEEDALSALVDEDDDSSALASLDDSDDDSSIPDPNEEQDTDDFVTTDSVESLDSEVPDSLDDSDDSDQLIQESADSKAEITPVEDEEDTPEISIDDLLEQNAPSSVSESLGLGSEHVDEDMLGKLDSEIHQQNEELDRITDNMLNEIEQLEMMGVLGEEFDEDADDSDESDDVINTDAAPGEQAIQSLDAIVEDLEEIDVEDMANADEFEDPLSDELLAELQAELPEEDDDALIPEVAEPEQSGLNDDLSDDALEDDALTDELLAELESEVGDEPTEDPLDSLSDELLNELEAESAEAEAEESAPVDDIDSLLDEAALSSEQADEQDSLSDELLSELENELEDTSSEDVTELDELDSLSDDLIAELESTDSPDSDELIDEAADTGDDDLDEQALSEEVSNEMDAFSDSVEAQDAEVEEGPESLTDDTEEAWDSIEFEQDETELDSDSDSDPELDAEPAADNNEQETSSLPSDEELADYANTVSDDEFTLEESSDLPDSSEPSDLQQSPEEEGDVEEDVSVSVEDLSGEDNPSHDPLDDALAEFDEALMEDIPAFGADALAPEDTSADANNNDDFDDSILDEALDDIDDFSLEQEVDGVVAEDKVPEAANSDSDDSLADLPGLDDWLGGADDTDAKSQEEIDFSEPDPEPEPEPEPESDGKDDALMADLDDADFDELLASMADDLPEVPKEIEADEARFQRENPDLDLAALFNEPEGENEQASESEDEFVDVESLLDESFDEDDVSLDDADLDLDVSLSEFTGVSDDDDIIDVDKDAGASASLDLARVYMEMDDPTAAAELLREVMQTGSDEQKVEASNLLEQLNKA